MTCMDIINEIRRAMRDRGMTQAELARRCELHPVVINRYFSTNVNSRRTPSAENLNKMLEALELTVKPKD